MLIRDTKLKTCIILSLFVILLAACTKKSRITGVNDTTAPTVSNVSSGTPTSSGTTVTWTTDEESTSQVEYGTSTSYGSTTTEDTTLTTSHSVAVTGLSASTVYHYRVKSKDASNNQTISDDNTFTTAADTTGPVISDVTVPLATLKNTSAIVTWTTDEAATTKIEWGTTSGSYSDESEKDTTTLVTSHSISVSGLTANTLYYYRVSSRDSSNNWTVDNERSFTTTNTTPLTLYDFEDGLVSGWINDTSSYFGDCLDAPADSTAEAHGGTHSLSFPFDMTALDPAWDCLNDAVYVSPSTTDLSTYGQLSIWMYIPAAPAPTNSVQATVYIKTGTDYYWYESVALKTITPGTWTEVTLDFSNAKHDDTTTNLVIENLDDVKEIGAHVGNGEGTATTTFYIDDVIAE